MIQELRFRRDESRSDPPLKLNNEDLLETLENKSSSSTRDLVSVLGVGKPSVYRYFKQLDFMLKKLPQYSA